MINIVPPEMAAQVWSRFLSQIEHGLTKGAGDTTTDGDILAGIIRGDSIMWSVDDKAIIVFQIQQYPTKKVLFIELIAGTDLGSWINEAQRLLREYADLVGAKDIEAVTRMGLTKVLPKYGWKPKAAIMRLHDGR